MTNLEIITNALSKIRPNEVDAIIERLLKERQLDEGTIDACSNEEWANRETNETASEVLQDAFYWANKEGSLVFWIEIHNQLEANGY
jgi:hypothetical protein